MLADFFAFFQYLTLPQTCAAFLALVAAGFGAVRVTRLITHLDDIIPDESTLNEADRGAPTECPPGVQAALICLALATSILIIDDVAESHAISIAADMTRDRIVRDIINRQCPPVPDGAPDIALLVHSESLATLDGLGFSTRCARYIPRLGFTTHPSKG